MRGSASAGRSGRGRTAASTTPSLSRSRRGRQSDTRVRVPAGDTGSLLSSGHTGWAVPLCPQTHRGSRVSPRPGATAQLGTAGFVTPSQVPTALGHPWGCVPVSPHPVPTEVCPYGWVCLPPPPVPTALGTVSWCPPVPSPLTCSLWLGLSLSRVPTVLGHPWGYVPMSLVPFPLTCDPVPSSLSRLSQVPVAPISLSAPSRGPCWWLPSS